MCPIEDNIERCIASMQDFSQNQMTMASRKREHNMNVLKNRFISEDEDDIVSLDPPPKIVLDHWDINITKMFSEKKQALLSATALMDLVVTYKSSLRNKTLFYAYTDRLSTYIIHHLNFIHECFHDMEYYRVNMAEHVNYYNLLEDVLAIYCSVELKSISNICFKPDSNNNRESGMIVITDEVMYLKRLGKRAQKISFILHNFLHCNEHVLHVLMKMWYNVEAPSCVATVRYLYTLLLHEKPLTDKSDESYCRYVINYLLWMSLEKEDVKESMLCVLNKKFGYDNGPPDSPFIKRVLEFSGEKLDLDKLISLKNMTIERYFCEIKKSHQRQMFDDGMNDDLRPYESFLFNSETVISSLDEDLENYNLDESDDVVEIITLDSDDDDDVQIMPTTNDSKTNSTVEATSTASGTVAPSLPPPTVTANMNRPRIRAPPAPTLRLHTPLIPGSMTTAAQSRVQRIPPLRRTPHLDNTTLSVLHRIAEAAEKAQFSNNGRHNSVCDSAFSDISERFAAKRAQVRSRARPSVDINSMSDMGVNPYMSPPSSSIGTPDNNYVEAVELAEVGWPKGPTSTGGSVIHTHASTNSPHSANLLLYTPDSQDERDDQAFELQLRTSTGSEDRDALTCHTLDEDHDTGQEQRKRKEPPQVDISPTSLPKRRKVNGDLTNTLLSPTSTASTSKDTTEMKTATSNILFTSSVKKRQRRNSDIDDKLPWERDYVEQNKDDDIFSNLNHDRLKDHDSPTKSPSQSTVPEHRYPTLSPPPPLPQRPTIPTEIAIPICYKAPVLEYEPPVLFAADSGVKGLLGSDVTLLGQRAVIAETEEVLRVATEWTHTEYVRDKGFVRVVTQPDDSDTIAAMRASDRLIGHVIIAEAADGRRKNGTPNKDILKEACADLLLHDADQDETIGTSSNHITITLPAMSILSCEGTDNMTDGGAAAAAAAAALSPASAYTQQSFDKFQERYQINLSAGSSCAGSVHGVETATLPNGLLARVATQSAVNGDGDSVHNFNQKDVLDRDHGIASTLPVVKEKRNVSKGVTAQVSSSSSNDPLNIISAKSLHDKNYTLRKYLSAYPPYLDLTRRKPANVREVKMPEMGRKRPIPQISYTYNKSSPAIRYYEVFCDDPKLFGKVGMDIQQIPFSRPKGPPQSILKKPSQDSSRTTNPKKRKVTTDPSLDSIDTIKR